MDSQVVFVKNRFELFLGKVAELFAQNPPPGRNAANGWFRHHMNNDPTILSADSSPTEALFGSALKLHDIYIHFAQGLRGAFKEGNHQAHWGTHLTIVGDKLEGM